MSRLKITGKKIPVVELIGAQPLSLDAGLDLTPPMQEKALEILRRWNVNYSISMPSTKFTET